MEYPPLPEDVKQQRLDTFAAAALTGLLASDTDDLVQRMIASPDMQRFTAIAAYDLAVEMEAERERRLARLYRPVSTPILTVPVDSLLTNTPSVW